jgi:hypothetical protein
MQDKMDDVREAVLVPPGWRVVHGGIPIVLKRI